MTIKTPEAYALTVVSAVLVATVAALAYRFPADVLVHALKFRAELALARHDESRRRDSCRRASGRV